MFLHLLDTLAHLDPVPPTIAEAILTALQRFWLVAPLWLSVLGLLGQACLLLVTLARLAGGEVAPSFAQRWRRCVDRLRPAAWFTRTRPHPGRSGGGSPPPSCWRPLPHRRAMTAPHECVDARSFPLSPATDGVLAPTVALCPLEPRPPG